MATIDNSITKRVNDLLASMTIEEKAGQLTQYFYMPHEGAEQTAAVEAAVKAGRAGSVLFIRDAQTTNRLQKVAITETRLGIPLLFGFDVIHGLRTIFPVPIGLAATWDMDLIEQVQAAAASEARAVGIHWTFAPMVDIARDPRWGRMVEGAGEDPYLGAAIAAAQVRGFQGDLGAHSVLACPKHFAGYGASRGGRDYDEAEISDSEMWNVYLPPFRAAVEAGAATIMSAYMDLGGVPAAANHWLLSDVLRDEFGFDGFVVSDANAVRTLTDQHFAKDLTQAGARAVAAGLDMEMAMFDPAFTRLPEALAQGLIDEKAIDVAVRRVLTAKFRLGLFEHPYADEPAAQVVLASPKHRALAATAAAESIVLLKNDDHTLPLHKDPTTAVAVVGQLADSWRDAVGPWVFADDANDTVTLLDGLRARFADVDYEPGASIPERAFPSLFDAMDQTTQHTPADYDDDAAIEAAVDLCADSDVAIVVVGQRQNQSGENASTSVLDLPGRQLEQLQRIVATGAEVVLVVMSGRPLDLRWAREHVKAIVQVWHGGTCAGDGLAAVLLGDVSPSGRLPFSWPRHVGQVPMNYSHLTSLHPEDSDKRYFDEPSTPLWPFGYGQSYASFEYSNLQVTPADIQIGETATVTFDIANTSDPDMSDCDADEVAQLYTHQRYGTSSRPVRELKGFKRVHVPAGQTAHVALPLGPEQLRYWSAGGYVQDTTDIDIWVGGSSDATLHSSLSVADGSLRHP